MNSGIETRRAEPADAANVRDLTRMAYGKWVPIIGREPLPMVADYERAVVEHMIDLFEENGKLLALVEMIPQDGYMDIENIAVRPDQQGRGLGETLLLHAENVARSLGIGETRLYTNAAFASNLHFYAKRGYKEVRRDVMMPGSLSVHMTKQLPPSDETAAGD